MKTFGTNDVIFARATMMGRELLNIRICGAMSMTELMQAIRQQLGAFMGMVNVQIRNLTQGWAQQRTYMLARA